MARDRLFINKSNRPIIERWRENGVLGFNDNTINTKEIFLIVASLGVNNPIDLSSKEGYVLSSYITTDDKSLLSCISLGKAINNNQDIDKYANIDSVYEEAEKCAVSGIEILNQIVIDSDYDNELIEKKMLDKLDYLYQTNVVK